MAHNFCSHSLQSESKYRQYICENSPELREFERKLQTAYNRKLLESQLAVKKYEDTQAKLEEKKLIEQQSESERREKERLLVEQKEELLNKKIINKTLQKQIASKRNKEAEEISRSIQERLALEEKLKEERADEVRLQEKARIEKERLLREQLDALEHQKKLAAEKKLREKEDEHRLREAMTRNAEADNEIVQKRQQRMEAFELVKAKLAQQLLELEKLKREREEISLRLLCLEKEENDRKKLEEEERDERRRREMAKQCLQEVTCAKRLSSTLSNTEEAQYAEYVKNILQQEEDRTKEVVQQVRRVKTAVRLENYQLMKYRRDLREAEMREERAKAMADMVETQERDKIVKQEKLRLLRSMDPDLIQLLPPGTVTEEDWLELQRK